MQTRLKFDFMKWLNLLTWFYFTFIFVWAVLHFLLGDHPWWMFALNAISFYFFVPLPLALLVSLRSRFKWMLGATLLFFALWLFLYRRLFIPLKTASTPVGSAVTVMSYNVMGYNTDPDAVVNSILAADPDVATFQELNPHTAAAIRKRLGEKYPYQQLDARDEVFGMGAISRYPLHLTEEKLPGNWVGTPQILSLDITGKTVTIVNAHAFASTVYSLDTSEQVVNVREQQARTILDFVRTHSGPLIVTTDFNATSQNTCYQIVTSVLADAWMEAGWGLGPTFPAFVRSHVPAFVIRIDYVFYSSQIRASEAQIRDWDGSSDHRPMWARLVLTAP